MKAPPFALPTAESIEALDQALDCAVDAAEQHGILLRHMHWDGGKGLDVTASRHLMEVCRKFLSHGVPVRRDGFEHYVAPAFLGSTWPEQLVDETGELFREYIRAGHVRLNDQVDAFGAKDASGIFRRGRTPLEVAIRTGNTQAAVVLIEEGARTDLAPSSTLNGKGERFSDMFQFADAWWSDGLMVLSMRSALMRRRITELTPVAMTNPVVPLPAPRHRVRAAI